MIPRPTDVIPKAIMLLISDPVVRAVIKEILENHGYQVLSTSTLGAAVDTLKDCRPELLITRGYVDNLPGYEAAVYLRKKNPGMPVLMLSGFPEDDRLTTRATLNGFEMFPKPYTVDELMRKVEQILHQADGTQRRTA
jgi:two-component system nitrogen regulation response regulator GlnG